jgi:hypothetical protein
LEHQEDSLEGNFSLYPILSRSSQEMFVNCGIGRFIIPEELEPQIDPELNPKQDLGWPAAAQIGPGKALKISNFPGINDIKSRR